MDVALKQEDRIGKVVDVCDAVEAVAATAAVTVEKVVRIVMTALTVQFFLAEMIWIKKMEMAECSMIRRIMDIG